MKKIICILAALTAMAACSKETGNEAPEGRAFVKGQQVTISACAAMDAQTKVVGTDDATNNEIDFTWEEGDQIQVKIGEATATFTLFSGAGTASATFKGQMPASGENFDIRYPVSDPDLSTQAYATDGKLPAGKIAFAATGCTLTGTNTLAPANSVLQLNLYGTSQTISKIVVTKVGSEATCTLNINPAVTLGTSAEAATPFYIVMPNGEYKISAEIFDNAATPASICSFTTSSEKEFGDSSAGSCVNMAAMEVAILGEAKIGSTTYPTLAEAITAANAASDATIELLKNVTVSSQNSISSSMTLDLDGYSINVTGPVAGCPFLVEGSDISLTIKDGAFLGGENGTDSPVVNVVAGASMGGSGSYTYTLNLTNVDFGEFDAEDNCTALFATADNSALFAGLAGATFTNVRAGNHAGIIRENGMSGNVTVKGGKYVITTDDVIECYAFWFNNELQDISFEDVTVDVSNTGGVKDGYCLYGPGKLKNCNFTSNTCAVYLGLSGFSNTSITLDGGTYYGGTTAVEVNHGTVTINSGTFTSDGNVLEASGWADQDKSFLYVNDGKFKGALVKGGAAYNTFEIKGGIYSTEPTIDCIASGYALELNTDESTKATYPYKVIAGGGPLGGGLCDIDKTPGSW